MDVCKARGQPETPPRVTASVMPFFRPILCAAAILILRGCGGAADGPLIVTEAERALGAEQHPLLLAEFGGAYETEEAEYVARVGERLAAAASLGGQCTFTLVNSDVVNAFAVPGCYIYLTRGLMAIVNSEDELASVLAHEIGHIAGDHSERQQRRSVWRGLGVAAVSILTQSERLARIAGQAAAYFTLRYSRGQEYEADDRGLEYLVRAGYDPYAAADMLDALTRQERFLARTRGRDEARGIPEWARTHPLTENRIARAREAATGTGVGPDDRPENRNGYLNEVDGLLYGDDPEQGFVIGRQFAHPVMRIGFEAPAGFTLTNSPQAILIEGPNGLRGEFGGGDLPPGGLDAYASGLLGRMLRGASAEIGPAQRVIVNGLRAIIAPAVVRTEQGSVPIALAAYDGGDGAAYHFVMVSATSGAPAGALEELFASFRLLSPEEIARLRPRRIDVVSAAPGDTLRSVAARMATEAPLDHLLMLNDRSADRPVRAGERFKIVTFSAP